MQVLEKILEEIEDRKSYHEELSSQRDDYEIQKMYCDEELNWIRDIIHSHMDDANSLEKKSVWEMDIIHHESYDLGRNVGWNECLETIQMNKNNDWIPVEERLPNKNGVYNVTRLVDDAFISDSAYFDGQDTWHNDNRVNHTRPYLTDIVAWQPLPEPYIKNPK